MYYVYIITNHTHSTLYTGVTHDMQSRLWQHINIDGIGFANKFNCYKVVYCEHTETLDSALAREIQIKKWARKKKEWLIEMHNPDWLDLSLEWEY